MQPLKLKHTFNLLDFLFTKKFLENKNFFIIEYGKKIGKKKHLIYLKKFKGFSLLNSFQFKSSSVSLEVFSKVTDLFQSKINSFLYLKIKNCYFKNTNTFLFFKRFFKIFNFFFYFLSSNFGLLKILNRTLNKK